MSESCAIMLSRMERERGAVPDPKEESPMKITKRNGTICLYDDEKVTRSILKANADASGETIPEAMAAALADEVFARLTARHEIITTAEVRACVFALLLERGLPETAACYMEFRK